MPSEIVIPKNNEEEFVEIASRLGIKKLYFLYDFDDYDDKKIREKIETLGRKIIIEIGFIVDQKNLKKASMKSALLAVKSSDKDREFIESKKIRIIYGFEEFSRKDYIHQRASGLNQILCEIARQNNVAVGFSYSPLLNKPGQVIPVLMGRMIQNINLCQKYKSKTIISSFSSEPFELRPQHDITSMFKIFGMNGKTIKNSMAYNF